MDDRDLAEALLGDHFTATARLLALVAVFAIGSAFASSPAIIDDDAYTRAAQLIAVSGDRRLNIYCTGAGRPTVLLEAGASSSTVVWGLVQPQLAKRTRVCSYDRAGMGFSDASTRPSDASNIVDDLHALLDRAGVRGPYILAAHSAGALYARLYAARYPDEVKGLVLVEPVSEYESDAYRSIDPRHRSEKEWHEEVECKEQPLLRRCLAAADSGNLVRATPIWAKCVDEPAPVFSGRVQSAIEAFESRPDYQRAALSEDAELAVSEHEMRAAPDRFLGTTPVIVLTEAPKQSDANSVVWVQLNARVATWSLRGEQMVIPSVGHAIQLERPDLVVDAIENVITNTSDEE